MDWLLYIFYGFISGLGQLLPVSTGAHDYYVELLTRFETDQPLMKLCIHLAVLSAVFTFTRYRAMHVYREMRIQSTPKRLRKRQPDSLAVLDGQVVLTMLLPAVFCALVTNLAEKWWGSLTCVSGLLLLSGLLIFVPHYLLSGNRDSRHISRPEAAFLGLSAGLSALPGLSWMGGLLSVGAIRGFSRSYMLDMALLLLIPLLAVLSVLDVFALVFSGFAGVTFLVFVKCLLSAAASFAGASLAIASMRFLSVNMGYTAFTYYNWGLGVFGFILYLMV